MWLTLNALNGTAISTGVTVTFTPNSLGATLVPEATMGASSSNVVGTSTLTV